MKIERTKKTISGSFWGMMEKITRLIGPYILRIIVLKKLGIDYLGLSGMFNSILHVLCLSELGFGIAVVYYLYKPIAEDDQETICQIVTYLKKMYLLIGAFVMVAGVAIMPFLPHLINGDVPADINLYLLYLIYLVHTALSYLLFAWKSSLLSAMQSNDIVSAAGFIAMVILYGGQVVVLYLTKNFYLYAFMLPVTTTLRGILVSLYVDKHYPHLIRPAQITEDKKAEIKSKIMPLMSVKISTMLMTSIDTIVITAAISLEISAIYNNYYYVLSGVLGLLTVIYESMLAGVGNSMVVENRQKVMNNFYKFSYINSWLITVCSAAMLCLYQPFIKLSFGKENLLPIGLVILFVLYFYFTVMEKIVMLYKDAAGLWREDMVRLYAANLANIVLSIILVKPFGLYGVIGASVLAYAVSVPFLDHVLFKHFFHEPVGSYYRWEIREVVISLIVCAACYFVTSFMPEGIIGLLIRGVSVVAVSLALLFAFYWHDASYRQAISWFVSKLLGFGKGLLRKFTR
ncbi:MAG: polysaccharide biosynthesis C-terminal domain-containing protein [Erysipelotrichaceae bacterium]|nr:polysaccharide biosynthesis C-terminal domain-containing protein [Erysipelotrichaceae bacterium]